MRLAFDATPLLDVRTGVGRFCQEVLGRLTARVDVVAYAVSWRGRSTLASVAPRDVSIVSRPMAARPLRLAWRHLDLPPIEWWTGAVDVVHGPNSVVPPARRAGRVVTVHDLTPVRFPELCTRDTLSYPDLIRRAVEGGAYVHTDSEFVAAEVVDHFDADPARVVAVPIGPVEVLPADPAEGRRLVGGERYVLALGTVEPRKDLPRLVSAFDSFASDDADLRLVIAGPDGWDAERLGEAVAGARHRARIVRLPRWVSEHERSALLRGATVFAYPSRYEGFGLPPLEAMAAGVPVVTTDAGALPEVVGEAAVLVPPEDTPALADAIRRALGDEALRARMIERGTANVERFSWDRCVEGLVDLYGRAAATSS